MQICEPKCRWGNPKGTTRSKCSVRVSIFILIIVIDLLIIKFESLGKFDKITKILKKLLRCKGNFYGSHCEIDGEVMAVAVGASVAAVIIIILTLICLCMWR